MAKVKGIEIQGMDELVKMLDGMDKELSASVIRNVARKPANRVVAAARRLFPYRKSGATKRTFGILKINNKGQRFLEVGVKGRSLAWIFMSGAKNRKHKKTGKQTGDIKPIGNILWDAASQSQEATKEIATDINKVISKYINRKRRRR